MLVQHDCVAVSDSDLLTHHWVQESEITFPIHLNVVRISVILCVVARFPDVAERWPYSIMKLAKIK